MRYLVVVPCIGGFMHLIGNMLYLWIFGNNVEDSMAISASWCSTFRAA